MVKYRSNYEHTYKRAKNADLYKLDERKKHPHFLTFVLKYVLPYLIINTLIFLFVIATPKIIMNETETDDYVLSDISFTVESYLPIQNVSVTSNDIPLDYTKNGSKYQVKVENNGSIRIDVTSINNMKSAAQEILRQIDELKKQYKDTNAEIHKLEIEVTEATNEIDSKEKIFNSSVQAVINTLNADKVKVSNLNV
jgi:peptidoglycan hydrolase CwlO-like protein